MSLIRSLFDNVVCKYGLKERIKRLFGTLLLVATVTVVFVALTFVFFAQPMATNMTAMNGCMTTTFGSITPMFNTTASTVGEFDLLKVLDLKILSGIGNLLLTVLEFMLCGLLFGGIVYCVKNYFMVKPQAETFGTVFQNAEGGEYFTAVDRLQDADTSPSKFTHNLF